MKVLQPLSDRIEDKIMGSDLLHADDTPIRVLDRSLRDKGLGKGVKKGRIWAYVRDQRPWAGTAPPGTVYRFAPDWKEDHVREHLRRTSGILQADGYKGYAKLYAAAADGTCRFREAACWAHLRRDFHDVWTTTGSEMSALRHRARHHGPARRDPRRRAPDAQRTEGRGLPVLGRAAVDAHPGQERSGKGLPLWPEPLALLLPVPRGRPRRH